MRRGQPIRSGILVFATVASCSFQQLFFHLFRTVGGTRNYLCRVAGYCFIFLPLSLYVSLLLWGEIRLGMMGDEAHASCLFTCLWCVPEV
ncbi:hypothetical protein V8C43DRAFT_286035 [Trichoderma afarasin]